MPQYSWGSVILCATYRGLCHASQRSTGATPNLIICYVFLQLWSWEHFPVGWPTFERAVHPYSELDDPIDGPTMGFWWTTARLHWTKDRLTRCYSLFHNKFESFHDNDIIWAPWTPYFMYTVAPHGLFVQYAQDAGFWAMLVFAHMVESYAPQGVMRQFDLYQVVAPSDGRVLQ